MCKWLRQRRREKTNAKFLKKLLDCVKMRDSKNEG
jgi:hypothetical protein